jgi:hypothetical protein
MGVAWASRITTIALELSVPAAAGFALDRWLSTAPLATLLGASLGFVLFMLHTVRIASEYSRGSNRKPAGQDAEGGQPGRDRPSGSF